MNISNLEQDQSFLTLSIVDKRPFFSNLLYVPTELNCRKLVVRQIKGWSVAEKEQKAIRVMEMIDHVRRGWQNTACGPLYHSYTHFSEYCLQDHLCCSGLAEYL